MTHDIEDPARERCLPEPPEGMPMYAENFMFAAYDPASEIGMWLHLGTWPNDFGLWEDLLLVSLPGGEDVLTMTGYRHTPVEERPAGSMLSFTCDEPFKHWSIDFDGLATRSTQAQLSSGLARDGQREELRIELALECVTDVWDGSRSTRQGSMEDQVWASDHYQQLLQVTGELVHGGTTYPIATTGVRDHSRGQRGHAMDQWGGHVLIHLLFPDGRAIGVQRMLAPSGEPMFDMAYTLIDGQWRDADVLEAPRLAGPDDPGDDLTLVVRDDVGTHTLTGSIVTSWPVTPHRLGMGIGVGDERPYGVLRFGHARWTWDGQTSHGLTERSFGVGTTSGDDS